MATPTLRDIAKEVGLSTNTVSRVLNGKNKMVWSGAAARAAEIRRVAQRLNYIPNAASRSMRAKDTRQVGVLLVNESARRRYDSLDAFESILGIDDCLSRHGYVCCVVRVTDVKDFSDESRVFREHMLDGLIAVGHHSPRLAREFTERRLPTVWLNSNVWEPTGCIRLDDARIAEMATAALIEGGWKKLVFVSMQTGPQPHFSELERYHGARDYAARHGMPVEFAAVFGFDDAPEAEAPAMPAELRAAFADAKPGELGLIAYNLLHARWLVHMAASMGFLPGRDYGLTCCDDGHEVSRTWPGLSRTLINRFGLGEMAADMLLQSLRGTGAMASSRTVAAQWVEGTTSRFTPELRMPAVLP